MAAADDDYVDFRRSKSANPFNSEEDDLSDRRLASDSDADDRLAVPGSRRGQPLQAINESSEQPTSSGTDLEADHRMRQGRGPGQANVTRRVPAPDSATDDALDDAYVGGRSTRTRSQRSKPSDSSVPTRSAAPYAEKGPTDDYNAFVDAPSDITSDAGYRDRDWRRGQAGAPPTPGPNVLSDHVVPLYEDQTKLSRILLEIRQMVSFAATALSFQMFAVLGFGDYLFAKVNPKHKFPPRAEVDKAWLRRIPGERYSARTEYYCEFWGYECEAHDVETEDGFMLRMYHVVSRKKSARRGPPILIQHGILCNSGNFVVNEERSMAFWFVEQGYDVWLGNIRTNFNMPHRKFERWDPRYWAWSFKEIGIYDCTASVEYVYEMTGQRVNYVGHSQGGGTMFLALSHGMRPDIADKMATFSALAPAVYAGVVLHKFPFSILRLFKARELWQLAFGQRDFFPILSLLQQYLPGWLFGHAAVPIFFFIFGFHDHNWVPRQVPKFFRTTPVATSAELLYFYMGNFSYNMCIFDEAAETWFPAGFPPLGLWYGDLDSLVDGPSLLTRLRQFEKNVPLDVAYELHNHEHLDMIWGVNVVEECFIPMLRFIENASDRLMEDGVLSSSPRSKSLRSKGGSFRSKGSRFSKAGRPDSDDRIYGEKGDPEKEQISKSTSSEERHDSPALASPIDSGDDRRA